MNSTPKHKRQCRLNGKKGGRPPGLLLVVTGDIDEYFRWSMAGLPVGSDSPKVKRMDSGGALVELDGREYACANMGGFPEPGRYMLAPVGPPVKIRKEKAGGPLTC